MKGGRVGVGKVLGHLVACPLPEYDMWPFWLKGFAKFLPTLHRPKFLFVICQRRRGMSEPK